MRRPFLGPLLEADLLQADLLQATGLLVTVGLTVRCFGAPMSVLGQLEAFN